MYNRGLQDWFRVENTFPRKLNKTGIFKGFLGVKILCKSWPLSLVLTTKNPKKNS